MSFISSLMLVIVVAWLAVTLVAQITAFRRIISPADLFGLIPSWTFFAPNPGIRDYHLVWREICLDGPVSWINVPISAPRPKYAFAWHPQKRTKKILFDAVQALYILTTQQAYSDDQLQLTIPYLMLLRYSQARSEKIRENKGQFAIIASWGHEDPSLEVSFVSETHSIS